jgi:glycosyltransferase involved in cell wall biosynthesis
MLLPMVSDALKGTAVKIHFVLINDASEKPMPKDFAQSLAGRADVSVVHLMRNLGHQRALAIGLAYVNEKHDCDAVLVMDCDGEDSPEDARKLVDRAQSMGGRSVVFAERTQRSENFLFRVGYFCYRVLHEALTGRAIRFGNFSVIPRKQLRRIASVSETWNHYAAAVVKSGIPISTISTNRSKRLTGESKMNFVGLVIHGLSAISVQGETIGVKLLIASGVSLFLLLLLGIAVIGVKLFTAMAIPGWATTAGGLLVVVFIQMAALSLQFAFLVLQSRAGASFIPSRDYDHFIEDIERVV